MRHEDITKTYKRADRTQVNEVNACAAKIARSLELEDRMMLGVKIKPAIKGM